MDVSSSHAVSASCLQYNMFQSSCTYSIATIYTLRSYMHYMPMNTYNYHQSELLASNNMYVHSYVVVAFIVCNICMLLNILLHKHIDSCVCI